MLPDTYSRCHSLTYTLCRSASNLLSCSLLIHSLYIHTLFDEVWKMKDGLCSRMKKENKYIKKDDLISFCVNILIYGLKCIFVPR